MASSTTSNETSSTVPGPNYKWHVVAMLWFIAFFNYADRQAIFSVFPLLEKEMGLDSVQLGLLGSSFAWVYGLGALFAGTVVDRIRRKTAILAGLQAWSIICMATASARGSSQLVFFRAAEGLGETFYFPASMSLVSDYHDKNTRSRAMGLHQTSVYVGTIGGGFFAGWIGQHYGWRSSFIVFGGLGILLGLVLSKLLIEPKRGQAEGLAAKPPMPISAFLGMAWRTRTVRVLVLAFVCSNFVATVLLAWMPKFLYDRFHLSLAQAGLTATVFVQLASLAGSALGGVLADSMRARTPTGRIIIQATGVPCGAPFVWWCGQTQTVTTLILALTGWGLFKGLYDANIFASVFDVVPPEARGAAAGLMNTLGWLAGGGSAPLVIGWIAKSSGLGGAISLAAIVYVAAGLLLISAILFFARADIEALQQRGA